MSAKVGLFSALGALLGGAAGYYATKGERRRYYGGMGMASSEVVGATAGATIALQTEPLAGTVCEGDEMVKFSGANLDAWRSRTSHALQVDISVGLTACAKIEVKECVYPSEVEADDVLVLKLEDDGTKTPARPWLKSHTKEDSLTYKYVVLMADEKVIAVAPVQVVA